MSGKIAGIFGVIIAFAAPANADWIRDMMIKDCSEESRNILAGSVRQDIELSVRRAEASMEPPAAIGDLGCLDGLMDVNIDVFAPVGPLSSLFSNSLDGLLTAPGRSQRICRFAHQKWNELSRPLLKPLDLLKLGLPPDFVGSFDSLAQATIVGDGNVAAAPRAASSNAEPAVGRADGSVEPGRSPTDSFDPVGDIWNMLYGKESR